MIYKQFAVVRRPNIVQSTTQLLIVSVCNFEVMRNIVDYHTIITFLNCDCYDEPALSM